MTGGTARKGDRLPLIAGNWKMNYNHLEAIALVQKLAFALNAKDFEATEIAVLPPFTALRSVQTLVAGDRLRIVYGAQDLSPHEKGAYTGDISGSMLAKLGCTYVTVGHSERRHWHGEDDALVNAKANAALAFDLIPIVCVGEGLEVRREGNHVAYTLGQLDAALAGIAAGQGRRAGDRLRAGLGHWNGRGGDARERTGGLRGDPGADFGGSRRWSSGQLRVSCMAGQ